MQLPLYITEKMKKGPEKSLDGVVSCPGQKKAM